MRSRLTAHWYAEPKPCSALAPLSALYGAVVALRRLAYRRGWRARPKLARPVVIVGNLTVGGTGKTPLTLWLAAQLGAAGIAVGILSRGYGRRGGAVRDVTPGDDWRAVGDEPLLIANRSGCPTVVAHDRVAGAQRLIARGAQLILCDDGLQHLRLERAATVIVLDGARGLGNGRLLPAGPLREPAAQLGAGDVLVVNGAPVHPSLASLAARGVLRRMDLVPGAAVALAGGGAPRELASFAAGPVHAVAGIGNPARFFAQLRAAGLTVIEHAFPDHHAFTARELAFGDALPVLMTEKDAVKCAAFAHPSWWYVPVSARFGAADAAALLGTVRARIGGRQPAGS